MKGEDVVFSHKSDEWETPQWLFDELNKEFHFNFDLAANRINSKCGGCYYDIEDDALQQSWSIDGLDYTTRAFCNPPYSQWQKFVAKASYEVGRPDVERGVSVVMLLPARTDTKAFHEYIYKKPLVEVRFIKGRLKFGDSKNSAPFPSMVVVFR